MQWPACSGVSNAGVCLQWEAAHGSDSDTGWQDEFAGTQEFEGAFEVEAKDRDSGEGRCPGVQLASICGCGQLSWRGIDLSGLLAHGCGRPPQ